MYIDKYKRVNLCNLKEGKVKIPPFALEFISDGCWLCGGSMRTFFDTESVINDLDFFFKSNEYLDAFKRQLQILNTTDDFEVETVFVCPKGELTTYMISYFCDVTGTFFRVKVQAITKFFYKDIEEALDSFDFTVCQAGMYVTAKGHISFIFNQRFAKDVRNKQLMLNKVTFPIATLRRLSKYVGYGFYDSKVCLMQLYEEIRMFNPEGDSLELYMD